MVNYGGQLEIVMDVLQEIETVKDEQMFDKKRGKLNCGTNCEIHKTTFSTALTNWP